jgi:hypothetical protein
MNNNKKKWYILITLSVTLFLLFYFIYSMYIFLAFSLHVNLCSCPFCFVIFFIETNRKNGQGKELLTRNVEESMQRCILLPIFHIQLFFIYFVYICSTGLQFFFFFLGYSISSSILTYLHVNCIFGAAILK